MDNTKLIEELITQTNRAACAEQQLVAMTLRWEMANKLNKEAREELSKLKMEYNYKYGK